LALLIGIGRLGKSIGCLVLAAAFAQPALPAEIAIPDWKNYSGLLKENWSVRTTAKPIQIEFSLDKFGRAYNLTIISGLLDIQALRPAILSILKSRAESSLNGNLGARFVCTFDVKQKRRVVSVRIVNERLATEEDVTQLKAISSEVEAVTGKDAKELFDLLAKYSYEPDCRDLNRAIEKSFGRLSLDSHSLHDILCAARAIEPTANAYDPVIDIATVKSLIHDSESAIGAYNFALNLDGGVVCLNQLSDLYLLKSQLTAIADKFETKVAFPKLSNSISDSDSKETDSTASDFKVSRRASGRQLSWKSLVSLLPADTETLIVARGPFHYGMGQAQVNSSFEKFAIAGTTAGIGIEDLEKIRNKVIEDEISWSITGIRAARTPNSYGMGAVPSINLTAFSDKNVTSATKILVILRDSCHAVESFDGVEILSFYWPFNGMGCHPVHYFCSPLDGVIINGTNISMVRESIQRLKVEPNDRALPEDLPEWKLVNSKSKSWWLRHCDKSFGIFDAIALSAKMKGTGFDGLDSQAGTPDGCALNVLEDGDVSLGFLALGAGKLESCKTNWKLLEQATFRFSIDDGRMAPKEVDVLNITVPSNSKDDLFVPVITEFGLRYFN